MTARFPPCRAAGLARLAAFVPHMGASYAAGRNADPGPGRAGAVSALSPYVRHRLVLEQELVAAALVAHGPRAARKFIQEVFWRAYWKGWLEGRPAIWTAYREEVRRGRDRLACEPGLGQAFQAATDGTTGIDCFDVWAQDLVAGNWLHNHVRMWFASIWIFTLRLPWALGAEFFARHLLDGDPASNTLSWRWVAGLHTAGRAYVARAENIRRYTDGRFDPRGMLDEDPEPLTEAGALPPSRLPPAEPPPSGDVALLLHTEDLLPEQLADAHGLRVRAIAALSPADASAAHGTAAPVMQFRQAALSDAADRASEVYGRPVTRIAHAELEAWGAEIDWTIVSLHIPVGSTADSLPDNSLRPVFLRRPWDAQTWPHAQRGFFQLDQRIGQTLRTLGLQE